MLNFRTYQILPIILIVFTLGNHAAAQERSGRIYGKIFMNRGEVFEGRILWGDHEAIWNHTFDAEYNFYDHDRNVLERQRKRGVRRSRIIATFSSMFGYIVSIESRGSGALVVLKDGREFNVDSGDAGEILTILDKELGRVRVSWRDFDSAEFMDEPLEYAQEAEEIGFPIFGTVTTLTGHSFSGFILWDNDESLSTHILDGKDGRYDREIPFSKIQQIRPLNRRSSEVSLWTGKLFELSGTNDVDSGNRGLIVADRNYGIVKIEWRDIEIVEFERNVSGMSYSDFKEGKPLYGVLSHANGDEYTGFIRWDDDEHITTDFLNGVFDGITMSIEFINISEIRRRTQNSAIVVLNNGAEVLLRDSNDVNNQNKGIVILQSADDPDGILFEWNDFEKVVFNK